MFSAFTMNTIINIAFGIKVNAIDDEHNPIIVNGQKCFNTNMSFKFLLLSTMVIWFPKLSRWLGINLSNDHFDYFINLSKMVIEEKRKQLLEHKLTGKANNFIELLLDAESEIGHNDNTKCLFRFA